MRTPQEVIQKRIRELESLDRPHAYDIGELANLRASLDAMWEAQVARDKADTAERVLERIALGDIPLTAAELLAVNERMNHASGTADRSVAVSMLEVIIGVLPTQEEN